VPLRNRRKNQTLKLEKYPKETIDNADRIRQTPNVLRAPYLAPTVPKIICMKAYGKSKAVSNHPS
jgi:hypothetical protein